MIFLLLSYIKHLSWTEIPGETLMTNAWYMHGVWCVPVCDARINRASSSGTIVAIVRVSTKTTKVLQHWLHDGSDYDVMPYFWRLSTDSKTSICTLGIENVPSTSL